MRPFTPSWISNHRSLVIVGGLLMASATVGCGGSTPVAESKPASPATNAPKTEQPAEQSPESVVSEFLDGVRRGGDADNVARLMTQKSRDEYAAAGLVMQPLGAPDAKFEVLRSVPYGDAGVLVNSLWTEKDDAGETVTYQVGWALKKETAGWRVSGLILEAEPEPQVFNFESREDVVMLKQMQEPTEQPPASEQTANQSGFTMPDLR